MKYDRYKITVNSRSRRYCGYFISKFSKRLSAVQNPKGPKPQHEQISRSFLSTCIKKCYKKRNKAAFNFYRSSVAFLRSAATLRVSVILRYIIRRCVTKTISILYNLTMYPTLSGFINASYFLCLAFSMKKLPNHNSTRVCKYTHAMYAHTRARNVCKHVHTQCVHIRVIQVLYTCTLEILR